MKALPPAEEHKALPAPGKTARSSVHKGRWWWIVGILLIALVLALMVVRHVEAKKKADAAKNRKIAPIPVSVAAVQRGDIGVHLVALGTVTPEQNVVVKTRIDGQLVQLPFKEGQTVKKGDLIALIDPAPYLAAVKQSEGQLARDQAQLKNARIDLERFQNVFKQHAISEQQVATQEALVEQDEGTVKLDEGSLDNARAQLSYTSIRSPLDGRVGLRLVDVGNMVHAADTTGIVVITQLQPITIVFNIPEDQVGEVAGELRQGHDMPVEAWNRDQQTKIAVGKLLTLDNEVDVATGTVKLKALFPNEKNELFPNQFVNARLLVKTIHDANLIPVVAIQRANQKAFVFSVGQDRKVQSHDIQVVTTDGDISAVTGVNPGDTIVTDGFDKLQAGSQVEVKTGMDAAQGRGDDNAAGSASDGSDAGKAPAGKNGNAPGAQRSGSANSKSTSSQ